MTSSGDEGPIYHVDPLMSQSWPAPQRSGFSAFWNHPGVIVGIMGTLVLLVTALSIVAITAIRSKSNPVNTNPAGAGAATSHPNTAPAGAPTGARSQPATNGKATTPAPDPSTFLSGHLELRYYSSLGGDSVDFDSATYGQAYVFKGEQKPDLTINKTSLDAKNRGGLHKFTGSGQLDQAGCADGAQWAPSMHVSTLAPDVVICFQTSDGRVGAITLAEVKKDDDGQLNTVRFDYVVWKKQGDQ